MLCLSVILAFSGVEILLIRGLSNLGNFQTAFIPFITAGDPDLATTSKALKILDSCGSDVIEVGVPYSDPLAGYSGRRMMVFFSTSCNIFCFI